MESRLHKFVRKYWLQDRLFRPERKESLPIANLVNYNYLGTTDVTRPYQVRLYSFENDTAVLIAQDDGLGGIIEVVPGVLDLSTGADNSIDYDNNDISITYDPTYLSSLTANPYIYFKIVLTSSGEERHTELQDLVAEVLGDYKAQELDAQKTYYLPNEIPPHLFDTFAAAHNWTIDRTYSEDDEYIRLQLKHMYDLYTNKRRKAGIDFAITIVNKFIKLSNMLATRGANESETISNYADFDSYLRFNTDDLLTLGESDPSSVKAIYDLLYDEANDHYPTKHFLVDLALNIVNTNGSLLDPKDIAALRFYTLVIRAKTQYPHFSATLGVDALPELTEQDGQPFNFLLKPEEAIYTVDNFESIHAGPNGVFSIASTGLGAWVLFPVRMNQNYRMNSGIKFNMNVSDLSTYITSFKLGTGTHSTLTDSLTDLDQPYYESTNFKFRDEGGNAYFECTVPQEEGNNEQISEFGLFNSTGQLSFYIKHPPILFKKNTHTLVYKIKLDSTP